MAVFRKPTPRHLKRSWIGSKSTIETADVSPVVATWVVPAVTATEYYTAGVAPVTATWSVPAVTAKEYYTAGVAPVAATWAVPSVTAQEIYTAGVAPVTVTWAIPAVTATEYYTAGIAPVIATWAIPAVTATEYYTAGVAAVSASWSVPAVTATEYYTAGIAPVTTTWVVPAVTAQEVYVADVSPVTATWAIPTVTATEYYTAGLSPLVATWSVPAVTTTGHFNAEVTPVTATWATPAVTATEYYTADLAPVTTSWIIPSVTATEYYTAGITPVTVTWSVPTVTANETYTAGLTPLTVSWVIPSVTANAITSISAPDQYPIPPPRFTSPLQAVYTAIQPVFVNNGLLTYSGFQSQTQIPYVHLAHLSTTLENRDTCLNRIDTHVIQVSLFSKDFTRFTEQLDDIRSSLLWSKLTLSGNGRTLLNVDETSLAITEPQKGLYQGIFRYELTTEKDLTSFQFETIRAPDIYTALFDRYTNSDVEIRTNGFIVTNYGEFERPFLFIPRYQQLHEFTTTLTRVDNFDFSINFESKDYHRLEELLEDIDHVFSYSRFILTGSKQCINLEWLGNSIVEEEPGFWVASTRYQAFLESSIN